MKRKGEDPVTRMESVRAATGTAKGSVLHAAETVAPYAGTAKDAATRYAHTARVRLGPKVSHAAHQARHAAGSQYDMHIAPRLTQARGSLPRGVDAAATRAAARTRKAARQAAQYTAPRVQHAVATAGPVCEEAVTRSAAAFAALRDHVTAADIHKLARRRRRRDRTGRIAKRTAFIGLVGAGVFTAWKWWDRQANPDWLVEPPAATELSGREPLTSVDGSDQSALDPEAQAKQADDKER
jgi:hypothetical protein